MKTTQKINATALQTFYCGIAMILVHAFLAVAHATGAQMNFQDVGTWNRIMLGTGLVSIVLPGIAGMRLRDRFGKYLVGDKVRNFPMKGFLGLLLFLCILESVKNGFAYKAAIAAFQWDVLHFLALSFLIIVLFVQKFKLNKLFVLLAISLIPLFFPITMKIPGLLYPDDLLAFAMNPILLSVSVVIFFSLGICFYWFCFRDLALFKMAPVLWFIFYMFFLIDFCIRFANLMVGIKNFSVMVYNLPLSILIQNGQAAGHIWPLFPWFSLVLLGFLTRHYLIKKAPSRDVLLLLMTISGLCFGVYISFFFSNYLDALSSTKFLTVKLYAGNIANLCGIFSFLLFTSFLCEYLVNTFSIKSEIINDFSEGILMIYVVHILLANWLIKGFLHIWPFGFTPLYVYPFFILFITYCIYLGISTISGSWKLSLASRGN